MNYSKIKIRQSVIFLIVFFILGFTDILGGPYGLGKFLFVITLIGSIFTFAMIWRIKKFAQKTINKNKKEGPIHVESTVIK